MMFSFSSLISVVVFFKQKTAYEMRISDWSSDVCSSDLAAKVAGHLDILAVSLGVEPLGAFLGIFPAKKFDIDPIIGHVLRQGSHTLSFHSLCRSHHRRWRQVYSGNTNRILSYRAI